MNNKKSQIYIDYICENYEKKHVADTDKIDNNSPKTTEELIKKLIKEEFEDKEKSNNKMHCLNSF